MANYVLNLTFNFSSVTGLFDGADSRTSKVWFAAPESALPKQLPNPPFPQLIPDLSGPLPLTNGQTPGDGFPLICRCTDNIFVQVSNSGPDAVFEDRPNCALAVTFGRSPKGASIASPFQSSSASIPKTLFYCVNQPPSYYSNGIAYWLYYLGSIANQGDFAFIVAAMIQGKTNKCYFGHDPEMVVTG